MKKYWISIILILLGISSIITFKIIGSEVAVDGRLIEPFGLIPIGNIFIYLGIIIGIVTRLKSFRK